MSWICPVCFRNFKHKNQEHSCLKKIPEDHFTDKTALVKQLYDNLVIQLSVFGKFNINAVQNAIIFSSKSTFLAVKPKKNWLDLEFLLSEEIDEFPVHKVVKISKNRYAHFVRLSRTDEIDGQLLSWLENSFKLISGAK